MSAITNDFPEDEVVRQASQRSARPVMLRDYEAAALLGIGRTKFRQMVSSGKAPKGIRFGRAIRWSQSELLDWVDVGCPPRDKWEILKISMKNPRSR